MLPEQQLLRIPGPTPIPPSVKQAMNQPIIGHRTEKMKQLIAEIKPKLGPIFNTTQDVFILTGSGTLALETAVVNAVKPDEEVLVIVTGSFGDRFVQICEAHHIHVHHYDGVWGEALDIDAIDTILKQHKEIKHVFATYCETSTGVLNPIQDLANVVHQYPDKLLIVDGVSCLGAIPGHMDDWGIDILITGSQKALMLPPGLSFMAASEQALAQIKANDRQRFYLDLRKYETYLDDNATPFTPAVSLLFGLKQSLALLAEEGLSKVFERHQLLKNMTRAAFKGMEIPLLVADTNASPTVTAVRPADFQADELRNYLSNHFNLVIAGGQKKLKSKIFRIGHMGYCSPADILQTISVIEIALNKIGKNVPLGTGTSAAQAIYLENN